MLEIKHKPCKRETIPEVKIEALGEIELQLAQVPEVK